MLTVGELIEAAREGDPMFGPSSSPNRVLYSEVSRFVRALAGEVQGIDASALTAIEEVPMPLGVFTEGVALPDHQSVISVMGVGGSGVGNSQYEVPIRLVNAGLRMDAMGSTAFIEAGVLYLTGAASRWANLTKLVIRYVPSVEDVTADDDTVPLPDNAHAAIVEHLRFVLTKRGQASRPPTHTMEQVQLARNEAQMERERYLRLVVNALGSQHFTVRDVTRGRYS